MSRYICLTALICWFIGTVRADDNTWKPLFDGETLEGWEGNLDIFRVEDGAIAGGSLNRTLQQNEFLCTTETYDNFVLRLQFRLVGQGTNAGVQFRSERIPDSNEVTGYQADLGDGYWGALYDESRRNTTLKQPDSAKLARFLEREGWNDYAIYANGRRVRLFINGYLTVDYVEPDQNLEQQGKICLQIHSGPPGEAWFRDIKIKELDLRPESYPSVDSEEVTFRKHVLMDRFIAEGITSGDVDRDGDTDLIAGSYWFEAPSWTAHEFRPAQNFSVHAGYSDAFLSHALDVNLDGWVDVVQYGAPGREAYWYENPQGKQESWRRYLVYPSVGSENPLIADVNGDGREDLIFLDRRSRKILWLEPPVTAGDTTWTKHEISGLLDPERTARNAHGLGFGDIDGDGLHDVFTIDAWWKAPADPAETWQEHPAALGSPAAQMFTFDADGDGLSDVVSSSAHAYGVWWFQQKGGGSSPDNWTQHIIDDRISQTHALAVSDLNEDGLPDLVTGKRFFSHNGNDPGAFEPTLIVWFEAARNNQGNVSWIPHVIDEDSGVGLQIIVEDVTDDGKADIITSGKKGVFLFEQLSR